MGDAAKLCGRGIDVKLAILGLHHFDRNFEFEHNGPSGSHPVPHQVSGCPRTPQNLNSPVLSRSVIIASPEKRGIRPWQERVIRPLAALEGAGRETPSTKLGGTT